MPPSWITWIPPCRYQVDGSSVQPMPHTEGIIFSEIKKVTQPVTHELIEPAEKSVLGPFVMMKLGSMWRWCGGGGAGGGGGGEEGVGCCQSHRQHNEHSIRPLPEKENTCETRLAQLQVPTAPSKSWWIYISPWALHLLVIQLIFCPPAPAHWLTPASVTPAGQAAYSFGASTSLVCLGRETNWVKCGLIVENILHKEHFEVNFHKLFLVFF